MSTTTRSDSYQRITDQIAEALEQGTVPWRKPWSSAGPARNLQSQRPYRGINQLLLQLSPYSSPYWTTYRAAAKQGGHVRKGEKGSTVLFWKLIAKDQIDPETGEKVRSSFPIGRAYTVFNAEQCDGLELPTTDEIEREHSPLDECEAIVSGMPQAPSIGHGGGRAFYSPATDHVQLPEPEHFESGETYYATAFHELTHSTGHGSRLARFTDDGPRAFGDAIYGREELTAEIGAAFLCGEAGISPATLEQSASYIANWLSAIREDARLIVTAAQRAQHAADFILAAE